MLRLLGIPPKLISTKGNLRLLFVKWWWPGTILLTVMVPRFVNNHLPIHALYMKGLGSQQNSNYLWMNSIFYSLMLDGIDSCWDCKPILLELLCGSFRKYRLVKRDRYSSFCGALSGSYIIILFQYPLLILHGNGNCKFQHIYYCNHLRSTTVFLIAILGVCPFALLLSHLHGVRSNWRYA